MTISVCIHVYAGGHTAEIVALLRAMDPVRYSPRVYVIADTDTCDVPATAPFSAAPCSTHAPKLERRPFAAAAGAMQRPASWRATSRRAAQPARRRAPAASGWLASLARARWDNPSAAACAPRWWPASTAWRWCCGSGRRCAAPGDVRSHPIRCAAPSGAKPETRISRRTRRRCCSATGRAPACRLSEPPCCSAWCAPGSAAARAAASPHGPRAKDARGCADGVGQLRRRLC